MRTSVFCVVGSVMVVAFAGCTPEPASNDSSETETSTTGDPSGDGDGDGPSTGDGDGDGPSTGDGDGDGPSSGDGDGDGSSTGDGDGDVGDWCPICVDPVDDANCMVEDHDGSNYVSFTIETDDYQYSIDEACTVTAVSAESINLTCETYNPVITLALAEPWQPNLILDEAVHLRAEGDETEWGWVIEWRIDREDESLAIAGHDANNGLQSVGFGAIGASAVYEQCAPTSCVGEFIDVVYEQYGLHFVSGEDEATLFTGNHGPLGDQFEIWTPSVRRLACDKYGDSGVGRVQVFVSALP